MRKSDWLLFYLNWIGFISFPGQCRSLPILYLAPGFFRETLAIVQQHSNALQFMYLKTFSSGIQYRTNKFNSCHDSFDLLQIGVFSTLVSATQFHPCDVITFLTTDWVGTEIVSSRLQLGFECACGEFSFLEVNSFCTAALHSLVPPCKCWLPCTLYFKNSSCTFVTVYWGWRKAKEVELMLIKVN